LPFDFLKLLDKYPSLFFQIAIYILLLCLVLIILHSIGLQTIGKREGIKRSWFAWIPFLEGFLLGKVVSFKFGVNSAWFIFVVLILKDAASRYDNLFANVFGYAIFAFMNVVYYWLFRKYSNKAILMTIFSVLTLNLITPIFIFAIRLNEQQIKTD